MGTDPDLFVHPERISNQLICPICTQVLENPVQTPTDHLFCEDELIEWMSRSNEPLCPVSKEPLVPDSIKRPSRIILNMLSELERYCPNKSEGCDWVGENGHLGTHLAKCTMRPRQEMMDELKAKSDKIKLLKARCTKYEDQVKDLKSENEQLLHTVSICQRKLKVYDAFFKEEESDSGSIGTGAKADSKANDRREAGESALQKIMKLRELDSFRDDDGK